LSIDEVFKFPTVKQVIFQIRYPNLFFIENKVADLQLRIMEKFPDSELRYSKIFSFGSVGPEVDRRQLDEIRKLGDEQSAQKIWTFRSGKDYELNILPNSLDITSKVHKTYDLPGGDKFRDVIAFVITNFFALISLPIIQRVGLRYIDECPIPSQDNKEFASFYNSAFPVDRFPLATSNQMLFRVTSQKDRYNLSYAESLNKQKDGKIVYTLDFDGFAENINAEECISTTDALHKIIAEEYDKTIKEPVKEFMRNGKLSGNV
jgi:uncharacterized protein (TIGR04255 family)